MLATAWFCPQAYRGWVIAVGSLIYWAWGHPGALLVPVLAAAVPWFTRQHRVQALRGAALLAAVYILVRVSQAVWPDSMWLPTGLVQVLLVAAGVCLSTARGMTPLPEKPGDWLAGITFFPRALFGPPGWQLASMGPDQRLRGICLFSLGMGMLILLATPLSRIWQPVFATPCSPPAAWMGFFAAPLAGLLALQSASHIACGLGLLMGHPLPENMGRPLRAVSLRAAWLGILRPLQRWLYAGTRGFLPRRNYRLVLLTLGGAGALSLKPGVLLWGMILGCFMLVESAPPLARRLRSFPRPARTAMVWLAIMLPYPLAASADLASAASFYQRLLPLNPGEWSICGHGDIIALHGWNPLILAAAATSPFLLPSSQEFLNQLTTRRAALCVALLALSLCILFAEGQRAFTSFPF